MDRFLRMLNGPGLIAFVAALALLTVATIASAQEPAPAAPEAMEFEGCAPPDAAGAKVCRRGDWLFASTEACRAFLADPRSEQAAALIAAAGRMPAGATIAAWCAGDRREFTVPGVN